MKISISIMAHPSRREYVEKLLAELGDVPVAWDEKQNIWDTCRRAWLMYDRTSDFHFVLQDDVVLGRDFYTNLQSAVANGTDFCAYSLYIGKPRFATEVELARANRKSFLYKDNIHHELAIGLPSSLVLEMVEYVDKANRKEKVAHDKNINSFIRSKKMPVLFPMPSLVDHLALPSLHKMNRGNYLPVANWFIGRD